MRPSACLVSVLGLAAVGCARAPNLGTIASAGGFLGDFGTTVPRCFSGVTSSPSGTISFVRFERRAAYELSVGARSDGSILDVSVERVSPFRQLDLRRDACRRWGSRATAATERLARR